MRVFDVTILVRRFNLVPQVSSENIHEFGIFFKARGNPIYGG